MADLVKNHTCKFKVNVFNNRNENILQDGETIAGQKNFTFSDFDSNIFADELINTENSPALHNCVTVLVWLLSGSDENFDMMVEKITSEVVEE